MGDASNPPLANVEPNPRNVLTVGVFYALTLTNQTTNQLLLIKRYKFLQFQPREELCQHLPVPRQILLWISLRSITTIVDVEYPNVRRETAGVRREEKNVIRGVGVLKIAWMENPREEQARIMSKRQD